MVLAIGWTAIALLAAGAEPASLAVPGVSAQSVYAYDPATGEVIIDQNADEPRPIGSVTKVATALVVVDHLDLDDEITIAGSDMVEPGYSAMGLQPGDTLTVEQLLTGLLVVSGGDAAWAFARTVGTELAGSDDIDEAGAAFVEAMNAKAAELGVTDSRFANPDGEDNPDAYATAHDVAVLYAALEANPVLAGIAAETEYSFTSVGPEATPYSGITTNQLAGTHGVISAKTGSEINAGGCIVLSRESTVGPIIIAVLGSTLEYDETTWTPTIDERWNDAVAVMDTIDAEWTPGQYIAGVATEAPIVAAPAANASSGQVDPEPLLLADAPAAPLPQSRTEPLLAITVTTGVLAFAGVFTWSRLAQPRY
jgi:D-alanyl-D-alanine carboxypeptidase (penicillin-binding protein 5/6)